MQIRPTALLLDKELVTDSKTKEDVRVSTVKDDDDEILDLVYWLDDANTLDFDKELRLEDTTELGPGLGVEDVAGAIEETAVDNCTELLIDVTTLDTELVDVDTLDTLALLDGIKELWIYEVGATLVVTGGTYELDVFAKLGGRAEELELTVVVIGAMLLDIGILEEE